MKGLILRVQPSGYKAFIVEWQRGKRKTLGFAGHLTLDEARAHALQAMAQALQQRLPTIATTAKSSPTLQSFLEANYEPWAKRELRGGVRYVERIRTTFQDLLDEPLSAVCVEAVETWWRKRVHAVEGTRRSVSKATASRDLACLRSALSKAVEWRILETNPLLGLRNKTVGARKVVRYLSADEEVRLRRVLAERDSFLIAARASANKWRADRGHRLYPELPKDGYGDHLTPIVLLAINTGLRRRELLSLQWSDIDIEGRMLTVRDEYAKNGKQRYIPLNAEASSTLRQWASQRGTSGAVFGIRDAKTAWTNALDAAGISSFRFHDLRHHFASKLVRAGVDLNTVRELLGHADIKMTLRYAHLSPEGLAAAVAKI